MLKKIRFFSLGHPRPTLSVNRSSRLANYTQYIFIYTCLFYYIDNDDIRCQELGSVKGIMQGKLIVVVYTLRTHWNLFSLAEFVNKNRCFDIRLVFTLPPRDSTLQYKRSVHFWNNFPCITSLGSVFLKVIEYFNPLSARFLGTFYVWPIFLDFLTSNFAEDKTINNLFSLKTCSLKNQI